MKGIEQGENKLRRVVVVLNKDLDGRKVLLRIGDIIVVKQICLVKNHKTIVLQDIIVALLNLGDLLTRRCTVFGARCGSSKLATKVSSAL